MRDFVKKGGEKTAPTSSPYFSVSSFFHIHTTLGLPVVLFRDSVVREEGSLVEEEGTLQT